MIIRPGIGADAPAVARLHVEAIRDGFLSGLGPRFLARLYRRMVLDPRSFVLVAEEDGVVVGQAGATEDVSRLYRQFLLHDALVAGIIAAPRLVGQWRSVLETLRYPSDHEALPPAELLSVAVAAPFRGRGVGRALVTGVNEELVRRGVSDARVVVAATNESALRMYTSAGFRPVARIQVHAETTSQVLTWS